MYFDFNMSDITTLKEAPIFVHVQDVGITDIYIKQATGVPMALEESRIS